MKKTAIILLFLLSFLGLTKPVKVGAFYFKGQTYFIEKHDYGFNIVLRGKNVLSLKTLNCYSSTGENEVAFVTDDKEIIWSGEKKFSFCIDLNPVLKFDKPVFYPLFFENGRFVFVGNKVPFVFDVRTEKKHYLPSLFYKNEKDLTLVFPADIVFYKDFFVYYADKSIISYSLEKKRVNFFKKMRFNFLTYSQKRENSVFFLFDYRIPVNVFPCGKEVKIGKKQEKQGIKFEGRIGKFEKSIVFAEISNSGFSEDLKIKVKVFNRGEKLFEKTIKFTVKLNSLKKLSSFVFYQVEKAVFIDLPEKSLVLCVDEKGEITLKTVGKGGLYSIVNGRLMFF